MKVQLFQALLAVVAIQPAAAVNMALFQPSADVDAAFADFLQQLYSETEDPTSTTTFTDFFPRNGSLIVLENTAIGYEQIVALKQALLPTDGSKIWDHVPNVTTVLENSEAKKIFAVEGVIQSTFIGGNCSQAYYSTWFTIRKDNNGDPVLKPHSESLLLYDDFLVSPSHSPTDIACQTIAKYVPAPRARSELRVEELGDAKHTWEIDEFRDWETARCYTRRKLKANLSGW